jgi:lysine 2,3-aminomutase
VGPNGVPPLGAEALAAALAYIAAHPGIWEVILTGGDPLMLSPARLGEIATELGKIAHIKILRLHSRVPVADPSRVTEAMIAALRGCGKAVYLVLHANHPRELTAAARAACARFIDAGIPVLSQSVLLRGVNDDSLVLENLMRSFVEMRVLPYYLHHPDLARGTAHLRVSIAEGQALISALRGRLSGLCQPRYVLDIPGGHGKVPIGPAYVVQSGDAYRITDYRGNAHVYPPTIGRSDEGEAP